MNESNLKMEIEYLFDCDYFADDFDPAGNEEHGKFADRLLSENKWPEMFESIKEYIDEKVKTEKEIVNFVNHYFGYGFTRQIIDNPYQFVAYFHKHFDIDKNWNSGGETIDCFTTNILETCGCIDLVEDPYYNTAKDKRLLYAIEHTK